MDAMRAFFSKIRALFLFSKKGKGGLPPPTPLHPLEDVRPKKSSLVSGNRSGENFIITHPPA